MAWSQSLQHALQGCSRSSPPPCESHAMTAARPPDASPTRRHKLFAAVPPPTLAPRSAASPAAGGGGGSGSSSTDGGGRPKGLATELLLEGNGFRAAARAAREACAAGPAPGHLRRVRRPADAGPTPESLRAGTNNDCKFGWRRQPTFHVELPGRTSEPHSPVG
mmetsp:Transcript_151570/g.484482  ORF Transcript_151570/g.484482 Transcript_151570/m.484482 type:complete len:164 (+) Transcript_151570:51-542(+)